MDWSSNIKVSNEDNMALMARYPDKHFDLAIVDPPYGIGFDGEVKAMANNKSKKWDNAKGKNYNRKQWDNNPPKKEYFNELIRVSKNQIIWGGNYFDLPQRSGWIFWDKGVAKEFTLSPGELAWTSYNKSIKKVELLWAGFRKCEITDRIHPTQKPVALYKWLLDNYAKEGDKILDTHLGSGSIALACHDYKFDLTACELDTDYYNSAYKRFKQHSAQQALF